MTTRRTSLVLAGAAVVFAVFCAPVAHADTGWVVAASSPSHEQMDFGYGQRKRPLSRPLSRSALSCSALTIVCCSRPARIASRSRGTWAMSV